MFNRILMPVDGTDHSEKVIAYVKSLADKFGSEIVIFNAQLPPQSVSWSNEVALVTQHLYDPEELGRRITREIGAKFDERYKVSEQVAIGDAALTIIETATELECDCIVICTHGMNATKLFLLGSVTDKVVHHAKVPVLVVR